MTPKTKRIVSIILAALPSLMLIMSGFMKLAGAKEVTEGLGKAGLGPGLLKLIGIVELASVALFWIPKTSRLGFYLLCSYLGGAICMELAGGRPPMAAVFLAFIWISVFVRDRSMFLETAAK